LFRIAGTGTSQTYKAERWTGSEWSQVGSNFNIDSTSVPNQVIVKYIPGASGEIVVYVNNGSTTTTAVSYTGDLSSVGSVESAQFSIPTLSLTTQTFFSEVVAATHSLLNVRLKTLNLTGAGATSQWTGNLTDINGTGVNDSTFIFSDAADQVSTFAAADLPTDSLFVDAIVVSGRMRRTSTGPQNADGVVRVGSTDYTSAMPALSESFEARQVVFGVDPSTSSPWSKSAVNALEIGLKSVA
jgi:hypothetical protein